MDERQKTLAAVTIVIGFIILVVLFVGALISGKKVISPVPEGSAIKIIFVTPSPAGQNTSGASPSATIKPTPQAPSE